MLWEHLTLVRIQAGPPNSMEVRFIGKTQSQPMPMGGQMNWFTQGFSLGILFSWFSSASIAGESIVSTASASDMLVHGAVFSLAFGYIHNFISLLVGQIESWESEDD